VSIEEKIDVERFVNQLCLNMTEKFEELERDGFSSDTKTDAKKVTLKSVNEKIANLLKHNPSLYNALVNVKDANGFSSGNIEISLHNLDHFDQIRNNIKSFLQPINEEYGTAIDVAHQSNWDNHADTHAYYSVRDVNNVLVRMHLANSFHDAAVYKNSQGQFTLHDSDPIEAHRGCGFAQYKCYHFIRGQLYKCGPVALMPEFDQQHNLAISDQDRLLLNSYQPLTVDHWPDSALQWLAKLDDPIAQCKFCPTVTEQNITIYPAVKGSKTS
jgi:hypothetical protein